jgi:hypothetical protein
MRFLDAAGVAKREKRNNPERALPRKERKAAREEKQKVAGRRQGRSQDQGRRCGTGAGHRGRSREEEVSM